MLQLIQASGTAAREYEGRHPSKVHTPSALDAHHSKGAGVECTMKKGSHDNKPCCCVHAAAIESHA